MNSAQKNLVKRAITLNQIKKKYESYTQSEDNRCTVCYDENAEYFAYYKCTKEHNICTKCYNEHTAVKNDIDYDHKNDRNSKCPTCSACLINELQDPNNLTVPELIKINVKNISVNNIYIHQNYVIRNDTDIMQIQHGKSKISFVSMEGKILLFLNMFICQDGFLYVYDKKYKNYHIAISKNKYQFWDTRRVALTL